MYRKTYTYIIIIIKPFTVGYMDVQSQCFHMKICTQVLYEYMLHYDTNTQCKTKTKCSFYRIGKVAG